MFYIIIIMEPNNITDSDTSSMAYEQLAFLIEAAYRIYYTQMLEEAKTDEVVRNRLENSLLQRVVNDFIIPMSNTEEPQEKVAYATSAIDAYFEHVLKHYGSYAVHSAEVAQELIAENGDKKMGADVIAAHKMIAGLFKETKWVAAFNEIVAGWNSVAGETEFYFPTV